jgi:hypothetical protein
VLQPLVLQLDDLDEFGESLGVEQELVYQLPIRKVLLEYDELLFYVNLERINAARRDALAELDQPQDVLQIVLLIISLLFG